MVDNELLQAIGQMITASECRIMGEIATVRKTISGKLRSVSIK